MNRADWKSLLNILSNSQDKEQQRLYKKIEKELTPIKPSSRKAKGRSLQQKVCSLLSEHTGIPWGYDNEEIQPRLMGGSGTDVVLTGDARLKVPFDIECKNVESFALKPTVEQAKANSIDGRLWLVVHKRKGMEAVAILDLEDFFNIFFGKGGIGDTKS